MKRMTTVSQAELIKCMDCSSYDNCFECECGVISYAIEVLRQYENTGLTTPEIIGLKERDAAKAPDYEGDGYDNYGNLIYDIWICPNCGKKYEVDYDDYDFCPNCGQRLKWEE